MMDSVWPVPNFLMCSIASSIFETDFMLIIGARYSVDQSLSEAGIALSSKSMVCFQHLISQFASARAARSFGVKDWEIFS